MRTEMGWEQVEHDMIRAEGDLIYHVCSANGKFSWWSEMHPSPVYVNDEEEGIRAAEEFETEIRKGNVPEV